MNNWKKEGLKELGLTEQDYNNLSAKDKLVIDEYLEELGH